MLIGLINILFLCLALPSFAEPHRRGNGRPGFKRHSDVARRASGDVNLYKRFSDTKWTFYDVEVGLGACGKQNKDSDFTVALNSAQFGGGYPGPHCFQTITMKYNGKTATATVMDECPGCPYGGLDLTRGLFSYFDSQDRGIIYGEWWFGSDGGDDTPTTTKKTTTQQTSTWTPPATTSTWEAPTTTSKQKTSTTSYTPTPSPIFSSTITSSSSKAPSSFSELIITSSTSETSATTHASASASTVSFISGTTSRLAVPTGTTSTSSDQPQNINALNSLVIQFAGAVVAGANANA
ncbi:RlpA-like double-psi beta-barrel-protein domain-containing protein-containing protein [Cyathus striatus]|nr:RlpA-like double-psi beta-barrel-protein domain-containing protein-containing protein [Cyathus striatus]